MFGKKNLLDNINDLEKQLADYKELKDKEIDSLENENKIIKQQVEKLKNELLENDKIITNLKIKSSKENIDTDKINDKGYQLLKGFKLIPPLLDKVLGKPFLITVAEEFKYNEAEDYAGLQEVLKESVDMDANLQTFRDVIRPSHSFRVTYAYSTKEYYLKSNLGEFTFTDLMFPKRLKSGPEVSSLNKSALYLAIKNKELQSAVLPETVYGAPLLSYAFPIFDDSGIVIGAVSFSNDISQMVNIARSLGDIVSSDSDIILNKLSKILTKILI